MGLWLERVSGQMQLLCFKCNCFLLSVMGIWLRRGTGGEIVNFHEIDVGQLPFLGVRGQFFDEIEV